MTRSRCTLLVLVLSLLVLGLGVTLAAAQTPKSGGHLNIMLREDLSPGFAVHESSTISTSFPSMPCFNNLVVFDQLKRPETPENIVGELAEKWSWQDNYRNLVFFLRKNVKWHDGQPFTSKDVKFTFDMLREAPEATAKLRINPAQGLVREPRGRRGGGSAHGGLPAQAAAAGPAATCWPPATRPSTRPTSIPPRIARAASAPVPSR